MTKKKITDENGNKFVEVKPWYKKWWIWLIAIIVVLIGLGLIGSSGSSSSSSSKGSGSASNTASSSDSSSTTNKLTLDYKDYSVASSKIYNVNYSNSDWNEATVKVNKVKVYKLAKPYKYESANDGTFKANGFVRLYFTIKTNSDVSIYPTQGIAVYSNGEQHEADSLESWDGDISSGVTKSGTVTLPVKDLSKDSSLSSIRFKFDANDQNNIETDHSYDMTINLNN